MPEYWCVWESTSQRTPIFWVNLEQFGISYNQVKLSLT